MPRLIVEKGHDKGKSIVVPSGSTVLVGRDSSAALQLRDTMTSRLHFKIEAREEGFWLHDLESLNGTLLNGSPVHEAKLSLGDLIKAGETFFSFVSEDAAATTMQGQRIGGYRIIERVGRGGMGTVYKAEQIDLQRVVALKVMSEEHTKDKEFIELFIHEARAAAKLNHPNIVQVYDVKRQNNLYYISMEFVGGGSVQEILNRQRKLPVAQGVQIVLDAARGLDYAHKKGIMHRDVKPDNLFLSETGMTKIGDMGLARGLNEKVGPEEETSVIGTPHYIAPEQVLGKPADFRSDIYSLGATAYRMLTGITPHNAPSVRDLVNKKVREDPTPPHEVNGEIPRALSQILMRMMARDPDARYENLGDVIADLESFHREQAGALADARREHTTAIDTLVANRKLLLVGVGLLILITAVVFTGALIFRGEPEKTPEAAGVKKPDEEAARQALWLWEQRELQDMDRKDPRSVRKIIDGYQSVVEDFEGTPQAARAAELRDKLQKLLRDMAAESRLEILDTDDKSNFERTFKPFSPRALDLGLIETTIQAYQSFSDSESYKGTPAAEKAAGRARHIRAWKQQLEKRRDEFLKISDWSRTFSNERRFKEAVNALLAFAQETKAAEMDCDFTKTRYRGFFYDESAATEAQAALHKAQEYWNDVVERSVQRLADDKNFREAFRQVDAVIETYPDEVAQKARDLRKELVDREAEETQRREEAKRAADAELLKRAEESFRKESDAARAAFLRFDFKGALQRMTALRAANLVAEFQPRLDRRVAELERAVHLKETLINVIKARDATGANPYGFKRDFRSGGVEGAIEDADEVSMKVSLRSGGTYEWLWSQFDAASFLQFIRSQWKYSQAQRTDANDQCDLAVIWAELGLYEEALAEIAIVMRGDVYKNNESIRKFCDDYKDRIEKGISADHDEIEAAKRLARLDRFAAASDAASARAEILILRQRYGKTKAFADAQKKIEEHLQKLQKEESEDDRKNMKDQSYRRLLARVSDAQQAARRAQGDILARLGKVEDSFDRHIQLGALYAASAEWDKSTSAYLQAKRAADAALAKPGAPRGLVPYVVLVYGGLYRNYIVLKEKSKAEAIKNEGDRRFPGPDGRGEDEIWTLFKGWLALWERSYPEHEKKIASLREEVRQQPDDPDKIWSLACWYMDGLQNFFEARGYLAYLQEFHPDFPQVRSGHCLYRLAEVHFAARELRDALKLYTELRQHHPQHPKVTDDESLDSVRKRTAECYRLLNLMGYPPEKQR